MTPTIAEILNDSCCSFWLKSAICSALERDPVDAANDAETLAAVLRQRSDEALESAENFADWLVGFETELRGMSDERRN